MNISGGDSLVDLSGHIKLGKLIADVNLMLLFAYMVAELGIGISLNLLLRPTLEENINGIPTVPDKGQFINNLLSSQPFYTSIVLVPLVVGTFLISPLLFIIPQVRLIGSHLLLSGLTWFISIYCIPRFFTEVE